MKLVTIEEHTFDFDLLDKTLPILDVGCRGFKMATNLASRGYEVIAIDADTAIKKPDSFPGVFFPVGLTAKKYCGERTLVNYGNGTGNYIITEKMPQHHHHGNRVACVDISEFSKERNISKWSAIKLDCEGSEYDMLLEWPGLIANQISVEFHEHVSGANILGDKYFEMLLNYLGQWYDVHNFKKEYRHCLKTPNYWDVLFTMK